MKNQLSKIINHLKHFFSKVGSFVKSDRLKKAIFGHSAAKGVIGQLIVYVLLIGVSYVFIFPILRMMMLSFMSQNDILNPEVSWIPQQWNMNNFVVSNYILQLLPPSWTASNLNFFDRIFGTFSNPGSLFKSVYNISILAIIQTLVSALTGFAFARYNFRFKKVMFIMLLLSFIIPLPMLTIPRIMMISGIQESFWVPLYDALFANNFLAGLFNRTMFSSLMPQILFSLVGQGINSAILILIFYNFFKMIPISLDESARIDGASSLQVFWHIYIRLVIPVVLIVFLFSFIWNWNDIYTATIFYSSNNPLIVMRLSMFDSIFADMIGSAPGDVGVGLINEGYKSAATFLSILPLMILYLIAQKQFIEGIERTGMTGE